MNKIKTIVKIAILFALFSMAMLCLFNYEKDAGMSEFLTHVLSNKAYALLFGYGAFRLYQIWEPAFKSKEKS